ncbi:MAG: hypothetical protein V4717_18650 [Bacteroidota bacterium]
MKKLLFFLLVLPVFGLSQRVGVGTLEPKARFAVDSSIMIDQGAGNIGTLSSGALLFGPENLVGIASRRQGTSVTRMGLDFYTNAVRRIHIDSTGNVGIGLSDPSYKFQVNGDTYLGGDVGISAPPNFGFDVGVYAKFYNSVGIKTDPTLTYSLDVAGPVRIQDDIRIDGILNPNNILNIGNDAIVEGDITVATNKGIVRSQNSTQLKVVRTSVELTASSLSPGGSVDSGIFAFETFGATPQVYVGNMISANNNDWDRVEFIPFAVTATGCKFRVINHSATTVSTEVRFAVLVIGAQ